MLGSREVFIVRPSSWSWKGSQRQAQHRLLSVFYSGAETWLLSRHRIFAVRRQMII